MSRQGLRALASADNPKLGSLVQGVSTKNQVQVAPVPYTGKTFPKALGGFYPPCHRRRRLGGGYHPLRRRNVREGYPPKRRASASR